MKRPRVLVVLALGVAAALAMGNQSCNVFRSVDRCAADGDCTRGDRCDPSEHYCRATDPVRVGALLSLTGSLRLRDVGQACRLGLEFARDFVSSQEVRPLDRGLDFTFFDDQTDPSVAAAGAATFVRDGALLVLGPISSPQALEAQKLTGAARLLEVTPFAGATAIGAAQSPLRERFLFTLSPSIANGSPLALVKYLSEINAAGAGPGCTKTVVIHNDDVTGREFGCTYAKRFRTHNMCVTKSIALAVRLKDKYVTEVDQVMAAAPDCVVMAANPDLTAAVLEEVERRIRPPQVPPWAWFGNTQTHTPELLSATSTNGRSRAEGFRGADVDYAPTRGPYAQLLALYNEKLVKDGLPPVPVLPPRFSTCADLGLLAALTIERAGPNPSPETVRDAYIDVATFSPGDTTVTPAQFVDALRLLRRGIPIDYSGASSNAELTGDGMSPSSPFNIWAVKNGAFDERVRQYDDGEVADVLNSTTVTANCPPPPDCP